MARAHNYVDVIILVIKFVLCISFHLSFISGNFTAHSVVALIACILWIGMLMIIMPYYHNAVPSVQCVFLVMAILCSFVDIIHQDGSIVTPTAANVSASVVVAALLPVCGLMGYYLAAWRVNPHYVNRMAQMIHSGLVSEHVATLPYPRTLTVNDAFIVSSGIRAMEQDLVQEITV